PFGGTRGLHYPLKQNKNIDRNRGQVTPCPAVCVWITPPLGPSTLRGEGRRVVSAMTAFRAWLGAGASDRRQDTRFGVEFSWLPLAWRDCKATWSIRNEFGLIRNERSVSWQAASIK